MKNFNWKSIGFEIHSSNKTTLDMASFKESISVEKAMQLLNLGLVEFVHPVHHIKIDTSEQLLKYLPVLEN